MSITLAALKALSDGDISNALTAATPGGIEAQESAGQAALVASTNMPKDMGSQRSQFEAVGFTFGDDVDDIFLAATLPEGWKREATSHSMHSNILDELGRVRVGVFYKAAFYDRNAHAHLKRRFSFGVDYSRADADEYIVCAKDQDKPFKQFGSVAKGDFEALGEMEKTALEWMEKNRPDFRDPTAYWNEA